MKKVSEEDLEFMATIIYRELGYMTFETEEELSRLEALIFNILPEEE